MSIIYLAAALAVLISLSYIIIRYIDKEIKALKNQLKTMEKTLNTYFEDDLK